MTYSARTVTPPACSVIAHIHQLICGGRWAGERELARRAGVGRGTVRSILTVLRRGGGLDAAGGERRSSRTSWERSRP